MDPEWDRGQKAFKVGGIVLKKADWDACVFFDECVIPDSVFDSFDEEEEGEDVQELVPGALHVHFGAGRLGLGLVVKAIEDGNAASYAVVQRPKPTWASVVSGGTGKKVSLTVNKAPIAEDVVRAPERKG